MADSFYDATYLNDYEEIEGAVNGENQTILETMKADMSALLQEKLGISTETTANFDELTGAGREQILREELGQADEKAGEYVHSIWHGCRDCSAGAFVFHGGVCHDKQLAGAQRNTDEYQ